LGKKKVFITEDEEVLKGVETCSCLKRDRGFKKACETVQKVGTIVWGEKRGGEFLRKATPVRLVRLTLRVRSPIPSSTSGWS